MFLLQGVESASQEVSSGALGPQLENRGDEVAVGDYIIDVNGINAQNATLERSLHDAVCSRVQAHWYYVKDGPRVLHRSCPGPPRVISHIKCLAPCVRVRSHSPWRDEKRIVPRWMSLAVVQ
eukprot:4421756-Amphidinium_carterae.1